MLAFIDALWLIGWSFVLSAPLLLLIHHRRHAASNPNPVH